MLSHLVVYFQWATWLEWAVNVLPIVVAILAHAYITRR